MNAWFLIQKYKDSPKRSDDADLDEKNIKDNKEDLSLIKPISLSGSKMNVFYKSDYSLNRFVEEPKDNFDEKISLALFNCISKDSSNPSLNKKNTNITKNNFFNKKLPSVSLGDYINRIYKYTKCSKYELIYSLILLDRYCKKRKLPIIIHNIYRLYFISLVISIKYLDDKFYTNKYYAKVGGLKVKELFELEYSFLSGLDWKLFISNKLFEKYNKFFE